MKRPWRPWVPCLVLLVLVVVCFNGVQFSRIIQDMRFQQSLQVVREDDRTNPFLRSLEENEKILSKSEVMRNSSAAAISDFLNVPRIQSENIPPRMRKTGHDPYYIKNNPPNFTMFVPQKDPTSPLLNVCNAERIGTHESVEGWAGGMALNKIRVFDDTSLYHESLKDTTTAAQQPPSLFSTLPRPKKRIMCIVYTVSTRHDRIRAIAETYAPRCDGFLAASNLTDVSIGAYNIGFANESYGNMWLKIRHIWKFVYDHFREEFDYFYIAGDDTFVIPENLRLMVTMQTWRPIEDRHEMIDDDRTPLLMGYPGPDVILGNKLYCMGGAGYVLNRRALVDFNEKLKRCMEDKVSSAEDRLISRCFRNLKVNCTDTRDPLEDGAPRFHILNADFHAHWKYPKKSPFRPKLMNDEYGIKEPDEMGQIPRSTVSFHLKNPFELRKSFKPNKLREFEDFIDDGMRRYFASIYKLCEELEIIPRKETRKKKNKK
ncbi:MAG: hypothetical protein SGILL_002769 [Bacillariaceae sp.]